MKWVSMLEPLVCMPGHSQRAIYSYSCKSDSDIVYMYTVYTRGIHASQNLVSDESKEQRWALPGQLSRIAGKAMKQMALHGN